MIDPVPPSGLTGADFLVVIVLFASSLLFGAAAVLGIWWAFRNGQFENFQRGATAIFDPDEPIGEVTDHFPVTQPPSGESRGD